MKGLKSYSRIERLDSIKNRVKRVKQRIALMLMLLGLTNWDALPTHPSGQAQAATGASLTNLADQSGSGTVNNGKIAFVGARGKDYAIHTMNADGSDRMRLTSGPSDLAPVWSPDGAQIAFVRTDASVRLDGYDRGEILVMNADGSNQNSLTPPGESDYSPAWSPDGIRIAFVRLVAKGGSHHPQIFVMNADGSNQKRLSHSDAIDGSPVWSPDGSKLAFWRNSRVRISLVVMNADGSDERIISQASSSGAWSPDGSKLAVSSYDQPGLQVISADGSDLTPITEPLADGAFNVEFDDYPSWSPDGSRIVFIRNFGCNIELVDCQGSQIWAVNIDGSNPTRLTDNSTGAFANEPTWSPDGTKIIFNSDGELFAMNADGSGVTNITNTTGVEEFSQSFQPISLPRCAQTVFATSQSFEASGGTGNVTVTADGECSWTATSNSGWITVTPGSSSGNGSVVYSVAANTGTSSRTGALIVAGHIVSITQAGLPVKITGVTVVGKKLFVFGENFDRGAVILLNGQEQRTINDDTNPNSTLIGKKSGRKIKPGDRLQVKNPNGTLSQELVLAG